MASERKKVPRKRKRVARKQLRVLPYFVSLIIVVGLIWLSAVASVGFKQFPTPKLGLDLQGGMTMTLAASLPGGEAPDAKRMEQARQIIEDRVNGTGVAEPEVYVEGNNNIVVNVAGKYSKAEEEQLREVGAPAELRFREVVGQPVPDISEQDPEKFKDKAQEDNSDDKQDESEADSSESADSDKDKESSKDKDEGDSDKDKEKNKDEGEDAADVDASVKEKRAKVEKKLGKDLVAQADGLVQAMAQQPIPPEQLAQQGYLEILKPFSELSPDEVAVLKSEWQFYVPTIGCGQLNARSPGVISNIDQQVVACDRPNDGGGKKGGYAKYLLSEARVEGKDVSSANVQPDQTGKLAVGVSFTNSGTEKWSKLAADTVNKQVAIVLDNEVVSAPRIEPGAANGGQVQISGDFDQDSASLLAEQLKYGSLPASFTVDTVDVVSATLGISQLEAGLLAGGIGVALVILYCLVYYRVLGFVVVWSLLVSGAMLYPALTMLGEQIGFTLTLAGVAGFIVAVGITADSFVVFFERLKDEMKEGRSTRSAVPRAWARARRTIMSADTVQLIGAIVLYFLAIGAVRGFAFTLGLSTLVDIGVVFLFTHPLVAWMSRGRLLNSPRLSGLHTRRVAVAPAARNAATAKES